MFSPRQGIPERGISSIVVYLQKYAGNFREFFSLRVK